MVDPGAKQIPKAIREDQEVICSIVITVYNHEHYIAQCLDSCLSQECEYPFEILLGEDDSDDKSRQICQAYAQRYPDKIRLFLNKREDVIYIDGRATGRFNFLRLMDHMRGRYMAVLSGDDYWSDPLKLQEQLDFLESHPEYSACHTRGEILLETNDEARITPFSHTRPQTTTIHHLLEGNDIITSSVVYRVAHLVPLPDWSRDVAPMLDWSLHLIAASHGPVWRLDNRPMAVYRLHHGGAWIGQKQYQRSLEFLNFCHYLKAHWLPEELWPHLNRNIYHLHYRIAYSCREYDLRLFWRHFAWCLRHARMSFKRYMQVMILLLVYLRIVHFDGYRIRRR